MINDLLTYAFETTPLFPTFFGFWPMAPLWTLLHHS